MAYSEDLVMRIRQALARFPGVEERAKMGGVTLLINGKVCARAHSDGSIMVRCRPELTADLLTQDGVKRFEMKGKTTMRGWLLVSPERTRNDPDLDHWIKLALEAVQAVAARTSLPT